MDPAESYHNSINFKIELKETSGCHRQVILRAVPENTLWNNLNTLLTLWKPCVVRNIGLHNFVFINTCNSID